MEVRVFFLQVAAIGEQDAAEVDGRGSRVNSSTKSFLHQSRNPPAVFEVRMRQYDRLDIPRIDRQVAPVTLPPLLRTLEHSAVDQGLEARAGAIARNIE